MSDEKSIFQCVVTEHGNGEGYAVAVKCASISPKEMIPLLAEVCASVISTMAKDVCSQEDMDSLSTPITISMGGLLCALLLNKFESVGQSCSFDNDMLSSFLGSIQNGKGKVTVQ